MSNYFVYRVNGGEVLTVSSESHASQLNSFFGEIQDPSIPDGKDLAVKKIRDGSTVRNATAQEISAFETAREQDETLAERVNQSLLLDANNKGGIILKALAQVIVDEINILRKWTRDFKTEVAAATNLANLQSRVATLATLNDRTNLQARTAVKTAIESGNND